MAKHLVVILGASTHFPFLLHCCPVVNFFFSFVVVLFVNKLLQNQEYIVFSYRTLNVKCRFLYVSQLPHDYLKFYLMEGNILDQLQYLFIYSSSSFVWPCYNIGSFLKRIKACILVHSREQKFNAFSKFVSLI